MWTEEYRITSVNQLQVKYNEKKNSIEDKVHRGWQSLTRFSRFVMSISLLLIVSVSNSHKFGFVHARVK